LTNINIGCYYTYMQAKLINHNKLLYSDGSILETKIWMVSKSQRFPRGYKYSLVYIKDGERVIGYDNAEGKGDHRHYCNNEEPYVFISLKQLINDFMADVKKIKGDLP